MAEEAAAAIDQGYPVLYFKVGLAEEDDVAALQAVRAAVGSRARIRVNANEAFDMLRYAARSHRMKLRELAIRVVEERQTRAPVVVAIARASRIRAASMRELSEAQRERKDQLETKLREQQERFREGRRAS